jgi:hypothetical protein
MTPEDIRQELNSVGSELNRASKFIFDYELAAERADVEVQKIIDVTYLRSEGNIEDRKALARQEASELKDVSIVARATYNRAKMKAKHLELEQMRLMAQLKSIQAEGA